MKKEPIFKECLKKYDSWNKERYNNRKDKDSIFPIGISADEFINIMRELFLGEDWYCVNPISYNQINEEILEEIIYKVTGKCFKERDKIWENEK